MQFSLPSGCPSPSPPLLGHRSRGGGRRGVGCKRNLIFLFWVKRVGKVILNMGIGWNFEFFLNWELQRKF